MKPSEKIDEIAGVFQLSNTVGSTQLDHMLAHRSHYISDNAEAYISAILQYLDEQYEEETQCRHDIVDSIERCVSCGKSALS